MNLKFLIFSVIYLYWQNGYSASFESRFKDVKLDEKTQIINVSIYESYYWGDTKLLNGTEAISKYCESNTKCLLNKDLLYSVTKLYSQPSFDSKVSGHVFTEFLKPSHPEKTDPERNEFWIGTGEEIYNCYRCLKDPSKSSIGYLLSVWDSKIVSNVTWYRLPNSSSSELWFPRTDSKPLIEVVPIDGDLSANYIYTNLAASIIVHYDVTKSIDLKSLREKYKVNKNVIDSFLINKISNGFVFFNFLVSDSEECEKSEIEKIKINNKTAVEFKLPLSAFFDKNGFSKLAYMEGMGLDCKKLLSRSMMNQ